MSHKHDLHSLKKVRKKGWSPPGLCHARDVFIKSETSKSRWRSTFDTAVLWALLILMVIGNIVVMVYFLPLLLVFTDIMLYGMFLALGISFGYLYQVVLQNLQHQFSGHHHLFVLVLVPYCAIVGAILILSFGQDELFRIFAIESQPWIMGMMYAFGFLIPYTIELITQYHKRT